MAIQYRLSTRSPYENESVRARGRPGRVVRVVERAARAGAGGAADTRLSPPAPELDEPGQGDRLVREGLSGQSARHVGRSAGAEGAEQRADPLHESRSAAGDAAADRVLAFRLARAARARDDGAVARHG